MVKIIINKIPRIFTVGQIKKINIKDYGKIHLRKNEQLTFISGKNKNQKHYDITKKNWGYYATPSLNGRLKDNNFKSALVKNSNDKIYLMIVEKEQIKEFKKYCKQEKQKVLIWLDEKKSVKKLSYLSK